MNALLSIYRKLDALQGRRWFMIAASAAVLLLVAANVIFVFIERPPNLPGFISPDRVWSVIIAALVALAWWGLVIWMRLTITFLLIAFAGALLATAMALIGWSGAAVAILGIAVLMFTFMVLIRVLLALYQHPNQVFAIAHTVIKESVRMKISVVFILILLIALPIIPLLQGDVALRYRMQSFIQYSTAATFYLAAFMTIFLACATVSFEIRDRQIWQLMTKPVSRLRYLLGKWLGIVSVNLALLVVAGASIFIFIQYLRFQPADNAQDRILVEHAILVAREGTTVTLPPIDPGVLRDRVERTIANDFTLRQEIENGIRTEAEIQRAIAARIIGEYSLQQRTVKPGEMKTYTFEGLRRAQEMGLDLRLRFRIHYYDESTHRAEPITFVFFKNGEWVGHFTDDYVPTISEYIEIPVAAVSDDGTLEMGVINGYYSTEREPMPAPLTTHSLNFDPDDLEILAAVGSFEVNYMRAMVVTWVKLAFLAMVGLACATVLSFPVATLVTFTILLAAIISPFLQLSLEQFYVESAWRIDKLVIKGIANMLVFLFEPFGRMNPTQRLVEGRVIDWFTVAKAVALLGVVWTGITLALGYFAFKDRELATYSGHG